jgi:predicted unusual protein kinase regulating ubiquinone biosynthesis (AarF/ABC1/UbiB family)
MHMFHARYRRITFFFARLLLGLAYWEILLPKIGFRGMTERTRSERLRTAAARMRKLAISMGGVMIKIGQFLSTRVDVLPPVFTQELEGLQDEVPPERFADLRKVVEAEFAAPLESIFVRIDENPVAAASIGQAHLAWLRKPQPTTNNQDLQVQEGAAFEPQEELVQVIVKIQRPNIEKIVTTDLSALDRVGHWLQWYAPIRRRVNISALLADFSRTLHQEMDYIQEGKNADRFAENFVDRPRVRVPRVAWGFTTRRVITLEDVTGIKITDFAKIEALNISRKEVAALLFQTYLQQIFVDKFFHADPHPGNLFVIPGKESGALGRDWQLGYVDFGMMGELTPDQRLGLREMAIAITTQDAPRTVNAYQRLGFLLPDADLTTIEKAGTEIFERFWGKSTQELREITIQEVFEFTNQYRDLMFSLPFQVPTDLILLGRALSILSGMCANLDPEFNIWLSVLPYAQELIQEENQTGWDVWKGELANLQRGLVRLPGRLNTLLVQLEKGELSTRNPQMNERLNQIDRSVRFLGSAILSASLLISGAVLFTQGFMVFGGIMLGIGFLLILWFSLRY